MKESEPYGRASQTFRSRELLASLTLSAEAITIPDALDSNNNVTTTATAATPPDAQTAPPRPRLGFSTISQMKVLAIQKHRRAQTEARSTSRVARDARGGRKP